MNWRERFARSSRAWRILLERSGVTLAICWSRCVRHLWDVAPHAPGPDEAVNEEVVANSTLRLCFRIGDAVAIRWFLVLRFRCNNRSRTSFSITSAMGRFLP